MSTRRSHLAGLGLTAAGVAVAATAAPTPAQAQPDPPADPLALVARRTELTLPELPALGVPYVCLLDLFDEADAQVGTATAGATVVGVTVDGPVVLASVVLHLADGEIHYQRVMDRFGDFPRAAVGAILGGTGSYQDATGEVDITWPDEEQIDLLVRTPG
ncbi:MAG: hypothetical protein GEV12_19560 [Micromonosporaceae bacterium]|nr:hypothetical protein [Micromonosporaceae bacterium]